MVKRLAVCVMVAAMVLSFSCASGKKSSPAEPAAVDERPVSVDEVKAAFQHAWNGYKQYAWGHDALKPLSQSYHDWYPAPLLMTPVDGYDTMLMMGLTVEAKEAKELILTKLSFDRDFEIQQFEVTIRLLGGLISAYQMDGDKRFLDLAVDLADRMLPVFESKTGMPYRFVNLRTGKIKGRVTNPAEIGTCIIEYGALSKLTGNPVYYEKAKRAMTALYSRSSKLGLPGISIDVDTGIWMATDSSVAGGIDSYLEYMLKGAILFDDPDLRQMWESSIVAVNKYLADETDTGLWYGHADMNTGRRTLTGFGALDAFFPGLLALGGDLDRAARLEDSAYKMWTLHGIEPEMLNYKSMTVIAPGYPLRPEIVESAYYLHHYTKDPKWRGYGSVYFNSLVKYCKTDSGFAALSDVRTKKKTDSMESFFLAETLKYYYLLFAGPEALDLNKNVFNTEAHPVRKDW